MVTVRVYVVSKYSHFAVVVPRHNNSLNRSGQIVGERGGTAFLFHFWRGTPLVVWHCSNHRLELAVGDTVDEVAGSNNFKSFFDKL